MEYITISICDFKFCIPNFILTDDTEPFQSGNHFGLFLKGKKIINLENVLFEKELVLEYKTQTIYCLKLPLEFEDNIIFDNLIGIKPFDINSIDKNKCKYIFKQHLFNVNTVPFLSISGFIDFQLDKCNNPLKIIEKMQEYTSDIKGGSIETLYLKDETLKILNTRKKKVEDLINSIGNLQNSIATDSKILNTNQANQRQEKSFKEVIEELAKDGELINFIEDNIHFGFDFFDKSSTIGFDNYNETYLTDLDKTFINFINLFCDSENDIEFSDNSIATTIENYTFLNIKLERELLCKFNEFKDERSQENFARLQKRKFEKFINFLRHIEEYADLIISERLRDNFDKNKSDFLNKISNQTESSQTDFEQGRQIIYFVFNGIVSVYLTVIRNITNSYFPSFNLKMKKDDEYIQIKENDSKMNFNQFTWSDSKTDLAELVYALAKTERIKTTTTGKPATKEELLKFFSEQFGQDITEQSLLSKSKRTYKKTTDLNTFTRKLSEIVDTYLKK